MVATRHRYPQLPIIYWTGSVLSSLPAMIRGDARTRHKRLDAAGSSAIARRQRPIVFRPARQVVVSPFARDRVGADERAPVNHDAAADTGADEHAGADAGADPGGSSGGAIHQLWDLEDGGGGFRATYRAEGRRRHPTRPHRGRRGGSARRPPGCHRVSDAWSGSGG